MTSVQRENDWPWHLAFGALLAVTVVTFGLWATGYVGQSAHYAVLAVTITFVLFMAFNIGGNDVANSFAAILDVLSTGEINAKAAVPGELMFAAGPAGVVHTHPDRHDLGRGNRQQSRQLVTGEAHRIGVGDHSAGGGCSWFGGRTSPPSGIWLKRLALAGVDAEQCVEGAEASNGGHCHDRCNNPQDDGQYAGGQHSADCGGDGDYSTDDAVDVVLVFSHDPNLIDISLKGLVEGTVFAPECLLHHYRLLRAVEKLNQSPAMCLNFRVACSCALFRA